MKKLRILVLSLDILAVIAVLLLDDIAKYMIDYFPECFFYSNFGILCPTCGATRCVFNFFSFNFGLSFAYNQYIFCLIAYSFLVFVFLNIAACGVRLAEKVYKAMLSWKAVIAWGVIFVAFAVYRII